jgi:hypothetical protein
MRGNSMRKRLLRKKIRSGRRCYSGAMLASEKQEILTRLEEGQKALALALDGVDAEEAAWKPVTREWSILECVEHLVVAEEFLFSRLEAARPASGVVLDRAREAAILSRGLDRSTRMESPEVGRPHGRFCSLQEAVANFSEVRTRTVDWVNGLERDPRSWLTDHPIIRGPVNCYEILLIISVHPRRHSEQIKLVRSSFARSRQPERTDSSPTLQA